MRISFIASLLVNKHSHNIHFGTHGTYTCYSPTSSELREWIAPYHSLNYQATIAYNWVFPDRKKKPVNLLSDHYIKDLRRHIKKPVVHRYPNRRRPTKPNKHMDKTHNSLPKPSPSKQQSSPVLIRIMRRRSTNSATYDIVMTWRSCDNRLFTTTKSKPYK